MASPAWFIGFLTVFGPSTRIPSLLSKSDRELSQRGYDREGLTRSFITGLGGF